MIKDTTLNCSSLNPECLLSLHGHLKWNMNFYNKEDSLDSNFYIVILFYLRMSEDLLHNWIIWKSTLQNQICQTTLINCFIWWHSKHTKILQTMQWESVSSEIFRAMELRITFFWDMILYHWVISSWHCKEAVEDAATKLLLNVMNWLTNYPLTQQYMTEEKNSQAKLTVRADNQPNNFRSSNMNMQLSGEKRNDMPMEKLFQDQKLLLQQPECTGVSF